MTTSIAPAIVGRITVDDQALIIERREYSHTGGIALLAFDAQTGELYNDVSTNLPGHVPSAPGAFTMKDETRTSELGRALIEARIILPTGYRVRYGAFNSTATEYVLNTTRVSIRVENHYADGASSAHGEAVPVLTDTIPAVDADQADVEDWIATEFLALTGEDRDPSIHATYHVEVTGIEGRAHRHLVGAEYTAEG